MEKSIVDRQHYFKVKDSFIIAGIVACAVHHSCSFMKTI